MRPYGAGMRVRTDGTGVVSKRHGEYFLSAHLTVPEARRAQLDEMTKKVSAEAEATASKA